MKLETIHEAPASVTGAVPILFEHGMWHAAWCWAERFLPYFARHGYPAHALSLRCHGGSEGREPFCGSFMADYVAGRIETFRVNQILRCGYPAQSMCHICYVATATKWIPPSLIDYAS